METKSVDWQKKTETEFGKGSYSKIYDDDEYNYLRVLVIHNQKKIMKMTAEFLPFLNTVTSSLFFYVFICSLESNIEEKRAGSQRINHIFRTEDIKDY